jgi:DNA-binding response OmpR family regulator
MKKSSVLLVEDDPSLGFVIQDHLKHAGYNVTLCRTGKEGLNTFNEKEFDICVLDVMLPEKDGFSLAQDIRKVDQQTPIIFLTARGMIEDKVIGFNAGGDDYLTKPFSQEELLLRVSALLRRTTQEESTKAPVFIIGKMTFDHRQHTLTGPSGERTLTKKEAHVLKLLCEHEETVLERQLILNLVWGKDDYFTGRSLDVFISKLRKYLKEDERICINNIHGVGFKLELNE